MRRHNSQGHHLWQLAIGNVCTKLFSIVPGPVLALMAHSRFTFIVLTWSAPQEPNGIIISYEVTYRVNDGSSITTNTTNLSTTFIISSLTPQTRVSGISVSAYTSIGHGEMTSLPDLKTLSIPGELIFQYSKVSKYFFQPPS
jgi:hypothetical protein